MGATTTVPVYPVSVRPDVSEADVPETLNVPEPAPATTRPFDNSNVAFPLNCGTRVAPLPAAVAAAATMVYSPAGSKTPLSVRAAVVTRSVTLPVRFARKLSHTAPAPRFAVAGG
jgi:hypothetical protein